MPYRPWGTRGRLVLLGHKVGNTLSRMTVPKAGAAPCHGSPGGRRLGWVSLLQLGGTRWLGQSPNRNSFSCILWIHILTPPLKKKQKLNMETTQNRSHFPLTRAHMPSLLCTAGLCPLDHAPHSIMALQYPLFILSIA